MSEQEWIDFIKREIRAKPSLLLSTDIVTDELRKEFRANKISYGNGGRRAGAGRPKKIRLQTEFEISSETEIKISLSTEKQEDPEDPWYTEVYDVFMNTSQMVWYRRYNKYSRKLFEDSYLEWCRASGREFNEEEKDRLWDEYHAKGVPVNECTDEHNG